MTRDRQDSMKIISQFGTLLRVCRVELVSLAVAIFVTAALANSVLEPVREWDATAVVMLIGGLWMAVCVALYQFLLRTSR